MGRLQFIPKFKSKRTMVFSIIVLLIFIVLMLGLSASLKAKSAGLPVNTAEAVTDSIQVQVVATGILEEVHKNQLYVDSAVMVKSIEVKEGDRVEKGQLLATLESGDCVVELEKARINLQLAQLELIKFRNYGLAEAQTAYENAQNAFTHSEKSLSRIQSLYSQGAASEDDLEREKIEFHESKAALEKARNNLDASSLDLENYENKVKLHEIGVKEAEEKVKRFGPEMRSPIDGIVTTISLKAGTPADPSQPAIVVSDLSALQMRVNVSEYEISKLEEGQRVELTTDAVEGEVFEGVVEAISPVARVSQMGQSTETAVSVTIGILDNSPLLKPGFSAKARIIADSKEDCIVLPFDAVITENNGAKTVFMVQNNTVTKREIEIGIESDFTVEVTKGLARGDIVVVSPSPELVDGMKVRAK